MSDVDEHIYFLRGLFDETSESGERCNEIADILSRFLAALNGSAPLAEMWRELEQELAAAKADLAQRTAEVAKAEAERDAAREDLDRTQRVLAKIDAVRTHQSEKLVRVYEAAGAEPEHYDNLHTFVGVMRRLIDAIESMGYEWRWTKSIDENGEQVGAWVMRDAAEADANNERFRRGDGE